jgi:aryl-alcohol dehydrogenase-like predicted oxidoreductase
MTADSRPGTPVHLLELRWSGSIADKAVANIYSNGVSEEIIGKAIKKYELPRHKLVILTKCFAYVGEDPGLRTMQYTKEIPQLADYVNQGGLSRQAIFNAVNASLKRLDTDYIDLLQIHRYDPNTPLEETMEALHDLVKSAIHWREFHVGGAICADAVRGREARLDKVHQHAKPLQPALSRGGA